ncbi:major facilitator superfamily MFS_1 [Coriobacterium glomerans PW2]|uniref:Major facilitator superfamily MFS_1 n=1 Tax=Coriobacterium glomerans (strain ATCC 49209 / DSM 20642 / JCM 10262 / PW2) TaxID=700015 RepID=F2N794_CORGP|nr:MFS transporter [Coriobacterium glomerans]AEB06569.1 major facilitator superfamily MFS_1 [Coriobacterium glomerans PW2]
MRSHTTDRPMSFDPIPTAVACAAFFLACMDVLITNIALPTISSELGGGMAAQQWIVDGYTLPFATLLLLAGNLSDRFGAKRIFLAGTVGFALSSLVCALAPTVQILIGGRLLLGISAALILPSSMSIINEAYSREHDRSLALSIWGIGGSAATACGPLLGGLLVPIHWSLVFAINVPVCIVLLGLCRGLKRSPSVSVPFDFIGQVLAIIGLGCLVGGIIEGGSIGFSDPLPVGLLAVGVIGVAAFLVSQTRVAHPMMPLGLFGPHGMRVALLGGFVMILNWNGVVFMCTLFLQQQLGLSPLASGLVFVPTAFISAAGNLLGARLSNWRGIKFTMIVGVSLMAVGFAALLACSRALGALEIAAAVSLVGIGNGISAPAFANLVLTSAPSSEAGIASAMFNMLRQVGGAIGIAVFGVLATAFSTFAVGLSASFAISFLMVAVLIGYIARSPVGASRRRRS